MTREIPLSQDKVALVDDADIDWLSQWKWSAMKARRTWYALRKSGGHTILMHRAICPVLNDGQVDHRDHDGLHNWRENLRPATPSQNQANRRVLPNNTSGYKGVRLRPGYTRYLAYIRANGRQIQLGGFYDPVEAARAYDTAARELFGEFASLNFPDESR